MKSSTSRHPSPSRKPRRLDSCRADFGHSVISTLAGPEMCQFLRKSVGTVWKRLIPRHPSGSGFASGCRRRIVRLDPGSGPG